MNKKYRGIMLIEVLVALMILLTVSMMAMTSTIAANKSKIKRSIYGNLDRISYCFMNEVKYNYSFKEIKENMLIENIEGESRYYIGFKYTDDILEKLTSVEVFDLEKGEDIKVYMYKDSEDVVNMSININMDVGEDNISIERQFNKSWWME